MPWLLTNAWPARSVTAQAREQLAKLLAGGLLAVETG